MAALDTIRSLDLDRIVSVSYTHLDVYKRQDQEGVQLGKVLAKRGLAHDTDGALKVYSDLLDI